LGHRFLNALDGKKLLDLPFGCVPFAPIIVSYPKNVPPPVQRSEPKVHWIG
jgi:hypothetical protein